MFQAQLLVCFRCGRCQITDPQVGNGWALVQGIDGNQKDVCQMCAGTDGVSLCPGCDRFYLDEHPVCPWCGE